MSDSNAQAEKLRKDAARKLALERRNAMPPGDIASLSDIIAERALASWEYQQARTVMLYASYSTEVRTDRLMRQTLADGKRLILPRVRRRTMYLDLFFVTDLGAQLAPGCWGIREPVPEACEPACGDDLDCIIAPGVAFDDCGGRLGYGGGYYDYLLASLDADRARKCLGLAFEVQIVHDLPCGLLDAKVAAVATEIRLIENR
jgi:5-formyltetrahydrofolate cyclo-ligase